MRYFDRYRHPLRSRLARSIVRSIVAIIAGAAALFAALPQITYPILDFTTFEQQSISLTIFATDADGDSLTYSLFQAPAGMTITGNVIAWMPNFNQSGVDTVIYRVTEHPSLSFVADTFVVTVLDVGSAGTYVDETDLVGLGDLGVTNAVAWADYNNDSIADVFVANAGSAGRLYRGG